DSLAFQTVGPETGGWHGTSTSGAGAGTGRPAASKPGSRRSRETSRVRETPDDGRYSNAADTRRRHGRVQRFFFWCSGRQANTEESMRLRGAGAGRTLENADRVPARKSTAVPHARRHREAARAPSRLPRVGCGAAALVLCAAAFATELEKDELKLGFIKLTDMAPLAIAYEKGYFEDEGLYVTLEPQANWKVLLDRVITGELDGAHMLAGQPLGATIGIGTRAHVITAFSMDLNGNAITVSNDVWAAMKPELPTDEDGRPLHPIKADALKPIVDEYNARGEPFRMGMVFPVSTHNYELRYWLAAGGIHPGFYSPADVTGQVLADVLLSVTPPPQMPATLEAGTIRGYSVGEPWN